jgi:hypothetical protein
MSPLLAVAIVLLVLVAGLALLQRRQTRDLSARPAVATFASGTAPVADVDPESDPDWPFKDDPVLGSLMFDGEGMWSGDLAIGGQDVELFLRASREGPGARHREWVQAAQERGDGLVSEARARLAEALARRGVDLEDPSLQELHVGPDAGGVFEGRLVFDPDHDDLDAVYVQSTDTWRTVEARVEMARGEG